MMRVHQCSRLVRVRLTRRNCSQNTFVPSAVPQVCEPLLAGIIVASQPGGRATAARLWQVNPDVLVRTVTGLYERDSRVEVLAAVLDVCQPVRTS